MARMGTSPGVVGHCSSTLGPILDEWFPQRHDYSNVRKIRLSTLSLPGPEHINQIKMIMYMASGRYRKSSSQSRNECPDGIVPRATVVIATIIWMISTAQARKQPHEEQAAADELNRGDEISHEMRMWYPGTCKCFIRLTSAAGNEELVSSRNCEKDPERNAGEQDRKLLPRTPSEQK